MKLGYSTWGMPTVPVEIAIRHIAKLGFDGIELTVIPGYTTELSTLNSSERQRIAKLLKDHHLPLSAIAAHSNLLATNKEDYQKNMWRLKGGVDLAVDLVEDGIMPAVNTTPGGSPNQWEELKSFLVERINELVDYAKLRGVTIAMEPHVGAIIDTPDKMRECLDLVDSPYFKVNFDISHFDVVGFTIEEAVAALAPHSIHTHVKDQRGRHPNFEFLIPGEGDFDYVTYLKEMQESGYDGFITVEVSMMVQQRKDYDPLAAATLSYQTLSRAFAEASIER
ncbi:TPA: sugar phosphate isomerase/epimerase [Candidatus Poribacteria bacterium]|jgi:sugar phosphate isomerase/epimerase|nr:sugar phosphate isomerase/epimerase [Candidatus Poribacteria bacterium]HIB86992.1 sugar phosphate isomerase/epimerase [Candidatus Poribacteria bacterium]HIC02797.1 sugar phosphate isomerase/epimerase [Candidatus Poribacteria bacterium]HIN28575.1 sugar phosphate isomerase/epimerase [Candidatus Poribacteria bacterium]HIO49472.1 sugar phosphate isomerase/epimerase [Candidatus Poribacteria bacterium]